MKKGKYSEAFASYIFIRVLTEGLNMIALDKPANLEEFFEWVEKLPVVKGVKGGKFLSSSWDTLPSTF